MDFEDNSVYRIHNGREYNESASAYTRTFFYQQPTPSGAVRKTNSSKKYSFLTNHQNKIATVFWPFLQNTSQTVIKSSALPSNCYHANKMNPSVVKQSVTAYQSFFQCIILSLTCSPPLHPAAPLAHAPTTTLCTKVILLLFICIIHVCFYLEIPPYFLLFKIRYMYAIGP